MKFNYKEFISKEIFNDICEIKVNTPEIIKSEAISRKRRTNITKDGRLIILATDHSARMITGYDNDPIRMGNKHEQLSSIVRILSCNEIDGLEGTPDIFEDLLILNYISKKSSGIDFLSNKLMIGVVNRGGLKGTSWEMDDQCTCFTVERIANLKFDGVKFMFRIDIDDDRSGKTIKYCSDIVTQSTKKGLPIFIESLYVNKTSNGYCVDTATVNLVKVVGVASALGNSASRKWLEVPFDKNFERVSLSTTCPILALPNGVARKAFDVVQEYNIDKDIARNIRGMLLGTNVLLPIDEDPLCLASAISKIWHKNLDPKIALAEAKKEMKNEKNLFIFKKV